MSKNVIKKTHNTKLTNSSIRKLKLSKNQLVETLNHQKPSKKNMKKHLKQKKN